MDGGTRLTDEKSLPSPMLVTAFGTWPAFVSGTTVFHCRR